MLGSLHFPSELPRTQVSWIGFSQVALIPDLTETVCKLFSRFHLNEILFVVPVSLSVRVSYTQDLIDSQPALMNAATNALETRMSVTEDLGFPERNIKIYISSCVVLASL